MSDQDIWVVECQNGNYFAMTAGREGRPFSVTFDDTPSSPTATIYKKGESDDLASTWLSGSNTVNGNVVTTKTVTPPAGTNGVYILNVAATIGSYTDNRKIRIVVFSPEEG